MAIDNIVITLFTSRIESRLNIAEFFLGITLEINDKCLSFDGDADRVVYFYRNSGMSIMSITFTDRQF